MFDSVQLPLRFNDGLVLRQLRYTGMLETVRIRQSGYSIKYTFQVRSAYIQLCYSFYLKSTNLRDRIWASMKNF